LLGKLTWPPGLVPEDNEVRPDLDINRNHTELIVFPLAYKPLTRLQQLRPVPLPNVDALIVTDKILCFAHDSPLPLEISSYVCCAGDGDSAAVASASGVSAA
jgi:hypothetical protein